MRWRAIILAAGRGPDDPMSRAYGVTHKCLIEIAGVPMLGRVVETLRSHPSIGDIEISIDDKQVASAVIAGCPNTRFVPSAKSAAASALAAASGDERDFPILLTTADHPLLTREMLDCFLKASERSGADLTAGLARAETILGSYPDASRTFLRFGSDRVSGCNLFGLLTPAALEAVAFWQFLEPVRKKPWRLVGAFGPLALLRFASGSLSLDQAFDIGSRRIGITARPVIMPFAEAAIDVDKPTDKELAEIILRARG